jgi:uncharacterized protein
VRLTEKKITAIKAVTRSVFGENACVALFGSRTEDGKKGGDIDLYIKCTIPDTSDTLYQLKLNFLVQLKKRIGDQKIDVLIDSGQAHNAIFKTVEKEGILL